MFFSDAYMQKTLLYKLYLLSFEFVPEVIRLSKSRQCWFSKLCIKLKSSCKSDFSQCLLMYNIITKSNYD